ncbi:MAG: 30S ribosomal protein S8 [Candidatus Paceibacterota bacterium]
MDQIADMITRIKNAGDVKKESLVFPYSKIKFEIASVLQKEGYLKSVAKKGKKVTKFIEAELNYEADGSPKVRGVQRVSKLSKRIYQKSKDLRSVKYGTGLLVLTTPKGIMTNKEAKKEKVGGEVLFKIW